MRIWKYATWKRTEDLTSESMYSMSQIYGLLFYILESLNTLAKKNLKY